MTTTTSAAPPAEHLGKEPNVLNGLVDNNLKHMTEVPPRGLMPGERICRHPDDRSQEVDWRTVGYHFNEDGACVLEYRLPDDPADAELRTHTFSDSDPWVVVEVGPVLR